MNQASIRNQLYITQWASYKIVISSYKKKPKAIVLTIYSIHRIISLSMNLSWFLENKTISVTKKKLLFFIYNLAQLYAVHTQ